MDHGFYELCSSIVSAAPWSSASFSQMSSVFILLVFCPPWNTGRSPSPWLFFLHFSLGDSLSHKCILVPTLSWDSIILRSLFWAPPYYTHLLLPIDFLIYTPEPQQKSPPKDLPQLTRPCHFHECYTHSPVTWSSNLVLIFDPYISLNPTSNHLFSILP